MICPRCGHDNIPGSDNCAECQFDLAPIDTRGAGLDKVQTSLLADAVHLLKPRPPVVVDSRATIGQAVDAMVSEGVGSVLIVDADGRLIGIFSERDLLMRVAGLYPNGYRELPIQRFMTPNPETVGADDPLARVLQKMDLGGFRHIPVVQDGRPVGLVTARDVVRHITKMCKVER